MQSYLKAVAWCFRWLRKFKVAGHLHKDTCASDIYYKRWDTATAEVLVLLHAPLLLEIPPMRSPLLSSFESPTCGSLFRAAKFQYLCHPHSCYFSSKLYMEKCKCAFLVFSGTVCQGHQERGKVLAVWHLRSAVFVKGYWRQKWGTKMFFLFIFFSFSQRWQQRLVVLCKYFWRNGNEK